MLRSLLRFLSRAVAVPVSAGLEALARARLGRRAMLTLRLDKGFREPWLMAGELEQIVAVTGARGLLLELGDLEIGWAALAQLRTSLNRMREQGALVVLTADGLDNKGLLLASCADKVLLSPPGEVSACGVSGQLTFIGPALERLGLRFDVEAAGAYKSFGETFTRGWGSPENREALGAVIADLQRSLVEGVAQGRRLSVEQVQAALDEAPFGAERALALGLVDRVCYADTVEEELEALLGEELRVVPVASVAWMVRWSQNLDELWSSAPIVAVVHLRGNVTLGEEPDPRGQPRIASSEVNPVISALREDERVKAVVLSIDSGGGSALASDLIWRELDLLVREKPLVAHLEDTSASGAYYIAAPALEIIASASTITGSIGVVGGKLVVGEAAARLGVFSETIGASSPYGVASPFDPEQRRRFRARLDETYRMFLSRVSAGRRRPVDQVHAVAQGRIWSGAAAVQNGLVDQLGDLELAVSRARARAGLRPGAEVLRRDLLILPSRPLWMRLLPESLQGRVQGEHPAFLLARTLGLPIPRGVELLLRHPDQPLALMPVDVELR